MLDLAKLPPTRGYLNFMSEVVESSLFRNGKVFVTRNASGNDTEDKGGHPIRHEVSALNARALSPAPTLWADGFELRADPFPSQPIDFLDKVSVVRAYYPLCEDLVKTAVGASSVSAFDHNVRCSDKAEREKYGIQSAVPLVHADYTLTSARERLNQMTEPPRINDTYRLRWDDPEGKTLIDKADRDACKRFAIVNVWRSIRETPVMDLPLTCCMASSVKKEDFVVFEIQYPDRIGENYYLKDSNRAEHKWCVFPQMSRDEALLLKTWDSDGDLALSNGKENDSGHATFAYHSALQLKDDEDAGANGAVKRPVRWSLEVRCIALFQ